MELASSGVKDPSAGSKALPPDADKFVAAFKPGVLFVRGVIEPIDETEDVTPMLHVHIIFLLV